MTAVGFTGTRAGMTDAQRQQLRRLMRLFVAEAPGCEFHVGGAAGADEQAVDIALASGVKPHNVHVHPCPGVTLDKLLAAHGAAARWFRMHEVFPPLRRNRDIVVAAELLVAAPATDTEQVRSGTWATVRYARAALKPVAMLSRGSR